MWEEQKSDTLASGATFLVLPHYDVRLCIYITQQTTAKFYLFIASVVTQLTFLENLHVCSDYVSIGRKERR
jgi:hypothetical protein